MGLCSPGLSFVIFVTKTSRYLEMRQRGGKRIMPAHKKLRWPLLWTCMVSILA